MRWQSVGLGRHEVRLKVAFASVCQKAVKVKLELWVI
jgi:hypothetical protein